MAFYDKGIDAALFGGLGTMEKFSLGAHNSLLQSAGGTFGKHALYGAGAGGVLGGINGGFSYDGSIVGGAMSGAMLGAAGGAGSRFASGMYAEAAHLGAGTASMQMGADGLKKYSVSASGMTGKSFAWKNFKGHPSGTP